MQSKAIEGRSQSWRPSKRSLFKLGYTSAHFCRVLWFRWRSNLTVHGLPEFGHPLYAIGRGRVTFTGRVTLQQGPSSQQGGSTKSLIEARNDTAFIGIGHNTRIDHGFTAVVERASVLIGSNVRIGCSVQVCDTVRGHWPALNIRSCSADQACLPVVVEDDVVIGSHVRIHGGVTIRKGSLIASHSEVTCDVPEYTMFAGSPARLVSHIQPISRPPCVFWASPQPQFGTA